MLKTGQSYSMFPWLKDNVFASVRVLGPNSTHELLTDFNISVNKWWSAMPSRKIHFPMICLEENRSCKNLSALLSYISCCSICLLWKNTCFKTLIMHLQFCSHPPGLVALWAPYSLAEWPDLNWTGPEKQSKPPKTTL